jgi:hypothetical protein
VTTAPVLANPKISYPPVKYYNYAPPSYSSSTLFEDFENQDGLIVASSHLFDNYFAGLVIKYEEDSYLTVEYTTAEGRVNHGIKQPYLQVDLDKDDYGRVYIGESDGGWNGEGYLFWDYSDPECGWYTFEHFKDGSSSPNGYAYYFDGKDMFIEDYNKGAVTDSIELPQASSNKWNLTEKGDLYFTNEADYSGFVKGGKEFYFGYIKSTGQTYRGEIQNGKKHGLGINVWDIGDVFIGHYENGVPSYGFIYDGETRKCYLCKNTGGETYRLLVELEGIHIDFDDLFNLD